MPDTVLVTGAAGFVGHALVPNLQALGFEVWPHERSHGDLSAMRPACGEAAAVVHLAGRTFVPESWEDPVRFYRDNTLTTAHVLEYCRHSGARLVYVSAYVYGVPQRLPIPETHPVDASSPYAHSKILAEDLVRFYQRQFGVAAAIVRPFNLYGPGQDPRFLIPSIVRQALDPAVATITLASLTPRRDYLHVSDLTAIIAAALRAAPGGVYNAGSGESISVADLARLVCELAPTSKPVRAIGEERTNEIPDTVADITRAEAELGWRPRVALRDGLRAMIASGAKDAVST
jgi:nucleoside-diphosphate-sugar epimerase